MARVVLLSGISVRCGPHRRSPQCYWFKSNALGSEQAMSKGAKSGIFAPDFCSA
jgi:hypothetical protein